MALKTRISEADFEKLNEALKTEYIKDGDGYKLDADYEDVTGLKEKRDELLSKLKQFKEFEGLDPKEVKAKLAALAEKENEELAAKGKWEELEQKLREKHQAEVAERDSKLQAMIAATARKDLELAIRSSGVRQNLAKALSLELTTERIKPVEDGGNVVWKTLDDTETVDLGKYIPGLKENGYADFFESTLGAGSGASGSEHSGGDTGKTITRAQYDANPNQYAGQLAKRELTITD